MPDHSPLQSDDPRRLGDYELIGRLGRGGQGVVYLGQDADGTNVAIKLLHPDLTENEAVRARFVREAAAATRVARFCTAQVIEADVAGDRPYIVSEYVPGPSLQRQVAESGPRSGADLERLAISTVTALAAIHEAGIVHRDFKPHNVLMAPDGPRVIDFGIAKALDAATAVATAAVGTPSYMAPEQVRGEPLTSAVDIFSWASTMVYAATGNPPFGQDTIPAVINRILHEEPPTDSLDALPDELRQLVRDCLAKEPGDRPKAGQLLMRLLGRSEPEQPPEQQPEPESTKAVTAPEAAGEKETVLDSPAPTARERAPATEIMPEAAAVAARGPGGNVPAFASGAAGPGEPGGAGRLPDQKRQGALAIAILAVFVFLVGTGLWVMSHNGGDASGKTTPTATVDESSAAPSYDTEPAVPPDDGQSTRPQVPTSTSSRHGTPSPHISEPSPSPTLSSPSTLPTIPTAPPVTGPTISSGATP